MEFYLQVEVVGVDGFLLVPVLEVVHEEEDSPLEKVRRK